MGILELLLFGRPGQRQRRGRQPVERCSAAPGGDREQHDGGHQTGAGDRRSRHHECVENGENHERCDRRRGCREPGQPGDRHNAEDKAGRSAGLSGLTSGLLTMQEEANEAASLDGAVLDSYRRMLKRDVSFAPEVGKALVPRPTPTLTAAA